jgi:hypothetical protein
LDPQAAQQLVAWLDQAREAVEVELSRMPALAGEVPELFRRCQPADGAEADDSDIEIVDEGPAGGQRVAAEVVL